MNGFNSFKFSIFPFNSLGSWLLILVSCLFLLFINKLFQHFYHIIQIFFGIVP